MSEVKITIIDRKGTKHQVVAPTDMSMNLMEVIRAYEIEPEGTIGICGGMAMCASCQVYILNKEDCLLPKSDEEDAMLSEAFNVKENSRLGCQIPIQQNIDGLEIQIAQE
ncbi:2Fe-2S iron-sulfur cluster binding domain-containing protein [Apibacter muscae]|uniref:2Fe-2S iron-sulfur cluster binding domain-containing protein n=1 Tax=Apibacter muscae TaxID=2509004 RepID=A0A563D8P8_9FLAO|nr:2Fe-2S iron-sulfur cluster-binding protein [Apibacter muscae]TWP26648.1 2Fe-2S iron-sulfur cluster binding domain-containing protein [Apibacter muscae]TWP28222.1 2Fe-2S iron-sulfur cluster binding domain-containing protein [Apibacter muscae]